MSIIVLSAKSNHEYVSPLPFPSLYSTCSVLVDQINLYVDAFTITEKYPPLLVD